MLHGNYYGIIIRIFHRVAVLISMVSVLDSDTVNSSAHKNKYHR